MTESVMRAMARSLFGQAVAAADPALAVRRHVASNPLPAPTGAGHSYLIAFGKAAPAMLKEALSHVSGPVTALCVTHHENTQNVEGAENISAGHPVPDAGGIKAGRRILELLARAGPADQIIALISGGGSALVPAPMAPLTLADKQAVNRALLESGLDIVAMNRIRARLSELKGGGFLVHAAPAPVTALILSDVIGDDIRAIASGPTAAPAPGPNDIAGLLSQSGLIDRLPEPALKLLNRDDPENPAPKAANHLIGSNRRSLAAMRAHGDGWMTRIVSDHLTGDVGDAATYILQAFEESGLTGPTALVFGGETTVQIRGSGRGGRNQELALRVAMLAGDRLPTGWVFLSGGTDGRDGPTDAAGGLVDGGTLKRIANAGQDVRALLDNNDSYAALKAAGDLLIAGATGTNVADVQVLLVRP